jgi:hypothetical protein
MTKRTATVTWRGLVEEYADRVEHLQRYPIRSAFFVWERVLFTEMATLSKPPRLAKQGMNPWRKWRFDVAFVEAQAALGECMYAAGIDDGELGAKISALNEQLRQVENVGGDTLALKTARRQLILQLAAAALVDDGPLPGADAEYRRAREAQTALDRHEGVDVRRTDHLE